MAIASCTLFVCRLLEVEALAADRIGKMNKKLPQVVALSKEVGVVLGPSASSAPSAQRAARAVTEQLLMFSFRPAARVAQELAEQEYQPQQHAGSAVE